VKLTLFNVQSLSSAGSYHLQTACAQNNLTAHVSSKLSGSQIVCPMHLFITGHNVIPFPRMSKLKDPFKAIQHFVHETDIIYNWIKTCHGDRLLCVLYGISHQYSADISAQLDNDWNHFTKSAKRSISQESTFANLWFKFPPEIPLLAEFLLLENSYITAFDDLMLIDQLS